MGVIIAFANQKGGVGKTTSAVNVSACLGNEGYKTLLIDLDPQGNATQGFGFNKYELKHTTYSVLLDLPIQEAIQNTEFKNVSIIPSNSSLAGAEVELIDEENRVFRLKSKAEQISYLFDFIIIDCPPALGLLTINGLVSAHKVIVPLQCEYYALEGLGELLKTVKRIKDNFNPILEISGILLTMYQHTNHSRQVVAEVQHHLGNKVFQTIIPRNVTLSEAPSHGKPIIYYDGKSSGAQAYIALTKEIIARESR